MWVCYKYDINEKYWIELGDIDLPQNCFGDELYDHMVEMEWVDSMDNYDVDGDSYFIAVMGKEAEYGEFKWEWEYDA